jgi:hypothetical protein
VGILEERTIFCPCQDSNSRFSSPQTIYRLYYAGSTLKRERVCIYPTTCYQYQEKYNINVIRDSKVKDYSITPQTSYKMWALQKIYYIGSWKSLMV